MNHLHDAVVLLVQKCFWLCEILFKLSLTSLIFAVLQYYL
jgi:hypothetical protein